MLGPYLHPPIWQPAADVYQTRNGWVVKYDLAGVQANDISLKIHDDSLILTGTRRDAIIEEECRHHRLEITYSRFKRTLKFPRPIDHCRISFEQHEGMLVVRLENGS